MSCNLTSKYSAMKVGKLYYIYTLKLVILFIPSLVPEVCCSTFIPIDSPSSLLCREGVSRLICGLLFISCFMLCNMYPINFSLLSELKLVDFSNIESKYLSFFLNYNISTKFDKFHPCDQPAQSAIVQ